MHLSVIIPSYRNSDIINKNVPRLLHHLSAKSYQWEVVIVDDGSSDNGLTKEVCKNLGVCLVSYEQNKGKGCAVRIGMNNTNGKFRIFTDADIPYRMKDLDAVVDGLEEGYDLVVGDRTVEGSDYFAEISLTRSIGSKFFSTIVGQFITGGQFDTQCGLKGFSSAVAKDIFSYARMNGFIMDVEIYYIAHKRKYKIKKIPVVLECQDGNSVNVIRHGLKMVLDLPFIILNYYLGRYTKQKNGR